MTTIVNYRWSTNTNFPSIVCRDMNSTFIERGRGAGSITTLSLPEADPQFGRLDGWTLPTATCYRLFTQYKFPLSIPLNL